MTCFLLHLIKMIDASNIEAVHFQPVLKEEAESLLQAFLAKEANESCSAVDMRNISKMVTDLLECFNTLSDDNIIKMKWLSPVLSTCIQTNNVTIRTSIQMLLTKMLKETAVPNGTTETPAKAPTPPESSEDVNLR